MEILLLFLKVILSLLISNWLVVVTTLIGLGCMMLIAIWVFHPDNINAYESYANIPLEDLLEGKAQHSQKSKPHFSIFL